MWESHIHSKGLHGYVFFYIEFPPVLLSILFERCVIVTRSACSIDDFLWEVSLCYSLVPVVIRSIECVQTYKSYLHLFICKNE